MAYAINRVTSDSPPTSDAIAGLDQSGHMPADIEALKFLKSRLSIHDFGRLSVQISRAAAAKRPSQLQRLLLSIIEHREITTS